MSVLSSLVAPYWFEKDTQSDFDLLPLTAGAQAPQFTLSASQGIWSEEITNLFHGGSIQLNDLLAQRPVVISFYSPRAHAYGHVQLETLIQLYAKIRALGGELLVFTAEPVELLPRIAAYYQVPFSLVHDANHQIAAAYGLYSAAHPVWQRVAGIEAEIALPGTYVVAPHGELVYSFVDADFDQPLPVRPVLSAIYNVRDKGIKKAA